jgi:hypothetical protein
MYLVVTLIVLLCTFILLVIWCLQNTRKEPYVSTVFHWASEKPTGFIAVVNPKKDISSLIDTATRHNWLVDIYSDYKFNRPSGSRVQVYPLDHITTYLFLAYDLIIDTSPTLSASGRSITWNQLIQDPRILESTTIHSTIPPTPMLEQAIPRTVHFIWIDPLAITEKTTYPLKYDRCVRSWTVRNPEYDVQFWNGHRIWNEVIVPYFPEWAAIYLGIRTHIVRCDLSRYLLLYLKGGVYSDMDIYCRKPIRTLIKPDQQFVYTYEGHKFNNRRLIANSIFACVPQLPMMEEWLDTLSTKSLPTLPRSAVLEVSGPIAWTTFLESQMLDDPTSTCNMLPISDQTIVNGCEVDDIVTYTLWDEGSGW